MKKRGFSEVSILLSAVGGAFFAYNFASTSPWIGFFLAKQGLDPIMTLIVSGALMLALSFFYDKFVPGKNASLDKAMVGLFSALAAVSAALILPVVFAEPYGAWEGHSFDKVSEQVAVINFPFWLWGAGLCFSTLFLHIHWYRSVSRKRSLLLAALLPLAFFLLLLTYVALSKPYIPPVNG